MRRLLPLSLLLLTASFSACLDFGEAVSDFRLQFTITGQKTWLDRSGNLTVLDSKVNLDKQEPGPMGGGGVTRRLETPLENASILIRLDPAGKYDGRLELRVRISSGLGSESGSLKTNLTQPLSFPASGPGRYVIVASLGRGILKESDPRQFTLDLDAVWTIRSKVHPVRLPNQPTPTNYQQMADAFEVRAGGNAYLDARTSFAGSWPSASGTDVDLEIQNPSEQPMACKDDGGGTNPQPHPVQSNERATVSTFGYDGVWTVRVGAISARCPGSSGASYANGASVPYELVLSLRGAPPVKA